MCVCVCVCVSVLQGEGEVEELGDESEGGATGMLTLYGVTRAQAGPYQCTADNDIAPPASVVGQLIVRCEFGTHRNILLKNDFVYF